MEYVGAILCGGTATRLPNKPLLPYLGDRGLEPLICSSVSYLLRLGISQIILLDHKDSIIPPVLGAAFPDVRFSVVVDDYLGIPRALQQMAMSVENEDIMYVVVCCDNLYPIEHLVLPTEPCIVTRNVDIDAAKHLSRYFNPGGTVVPHWITRNHPGYSLSALTTPWFLPSKMLRYVSGQCADIIDFLNEFRVSPLVRPTAGWRDLGTTETYIRYWAEIHAKTLEDRQGGSDPSAVDVLFRSVPTLHPKKSQH